MRCDLIVNKYEGVNYYKVQAGDGCQDIVDKNRTFTLHDFYDWNPYVPDYRKPAVST